MPKKPVNPAAPVIVETPAAPPAIDAVVGVTPAAPEAPEPVPAPMPPDISLPVPVAPAAPALDIAAFQAKVYEEPRCWMLVTDVYENVLGGDPTEVKTVSEPLRVTARAMRVKLHKGVGGLEQKPEPQEFAIVLMWPTERRRRPHCGIFYDGKVLHATPDAVLHQDLASLRDAYPVMEFWAAA